jgi:hypothetical protein
MFTNIFPPLVDPGQPLGNWSYPLAILSLSCAARLFTNYQNKNERSTSPDGRMAMPYPCTSIGLFTKQDNFREYQ